MCSLQGPFTVICDVGSHLDSTLELYSLEFLNTNPFCIELKGYSDFRNMWDRLHGPLGRTEVNKSVNPMNLCE